ncbi:MAG: DUF6711 family protein [Anaerovoracaceae bacterium]
MKLLKLDGYACPSPTKYDVTLQSIDSDSTGRNEKGIMSREMVRAGVYKIQADWTNLTSAQTAAILSRAAKESISVAFEFGGTKTAKMYAGDRELQLKSVDGNNCVWDLGFSLVEF